MGLSSFLSSLYMFFFFKFRQFIVVDYDRYGHTPAGTPPWYPARVVAHIRTPVQMAWCKGNLYLELFLHPTSPFFVMDARECLRASSQNTCDLVKNHENKISEQD